MKKDKKYIITIIILIIMLVIIISMIGAKNLKNKHKEINNSEKQEEYNKYEENFTGKIKCELEDKDNIDIYMAYFIENMEVENGKIKSNEIKRKIKYLNENNYKGFKENEEVINPIYDDENLTIEYITDEKFTMHDEDVNTYVKELEDLGYKCEKVID